MEIKEFNKVWGVFEKQFKRENYKMPYCHPAHQKYPEYIQSSRFQWIATTFALWLPYLQDYLKKKNEMQTPICVDPANK